MALDKDMIIIYTLIALMAILLIIIFTLDAKSKRKAPDDEKIVIEGTVPIEKYQEANNLQVKIEKKIEELEKSKIKEEKIEQPKDLLEIQTEPIIQEPKENIEKIEENIKYVPEKTIDEQKEEAQEELHQVVENLIEDKPDTIELTNFEIEQEENAIISYNELIKVSENLYEENEKTQYADEGNEPITIEQLREKFETKEIVEEVEEESKQKDLVSALDEIMQYEQKHMDKKQNIEIKEDSNDVSKAERTKIKLNDFIDKKQEEKMESTPKFKSSPIISPVYGIEKEEVVKKSTEIELEQTADLEKLDAEIRKTNQFLQVLKELQKKLD